MAAVFKKEFRSYFTNMIGYVLIAFILAVIGIFTSAINLTSGFPYFEIALANTTFIFLIIIPVLTMRVLADEKRQKTDQLLYTAPVSVTKIILGKYFAMLAVYAIPLLLCCFYPLWLSAYGPVPFVATYTGVFAFFLMGAALIAIGMFMSSLTESQVIAAVSSFAAMLAAYLAPALASLVSSSARGSFFAFSILLILLVILLYFMTKNFLLAAITGVVCQTALIILLSASPQTLENGFAKALGLLAIFSRFDPFVNGILDLSGILYFLTVAVLFVFLSVQSVEKRRWS